MTQHDIEKFLQEHFPKSTTRFLGEGWTSLAFHIDDSIARFPKYDIKWYEREAFILSTVRKHTHFAIPEISLQQIAGIDFSIHQAINGDHWDFEKYESWSRPNQISFVRDCARFLHELHSIPIECFIGLPEKPYPKKPKYREKKEIYDIVGGKIPRAVFDKIYAKYRDACDRYVGDVVFLHKDFCGKNSVVGKDFRLAGVFDFGNSALGDRTREFAFLYDPDHPKFLQDLLTEYEKISGIGIEMQNIKDYMLRSIMNSTPELRDPELATIRENVVEERAKKIMFFA